MGSVQGPIVHQLQDPSMSSHLVNFPSPIPKVILPCLPGRSRNLPIQKGSPAAKSFIQQVIGCWGSQLRRPLFQCPWTLGSILAWEHSLSALREENKPGLCRPGAGQRGDRPSVSLHMLVRRQRVQPPSVLQHHMVEPVLWPSQAP